MSDFIPRRPLPLGAKQGNGGADTPPAHHRLQDNQPGKRQAADHDKPLAVVFPPLSLPRATVEWERVLDGETPRVPNGLQLQTVRARGLAEAAQHQRNNH